MADTAAQTLPATAEAPRAASARLDDVMLAMDVVDTLRHQDVLVARELDETRREAELIERLRQIYRGQGIEVPDRVLAEGVRALKESRFVYTPPRPGLATTLARLWVARERYGKALAALLLALGLGWGTYYFGFVRPAQVEIGQTLPRALSQAHEAALAEARTDAARERADRLAADGRAALDRRDTAAARQAIAALETLRAELPREYTLRIVSAVFKVPPRAHRPPGGRPARVPCPSAPRRAPPHGPGSTPSAGSARSPPARAAHSRNTRCPSRGRGR